MAKKAFSKAVAISHLEAASTDKPVQDAEAPSFSMDEILAGNSDFNVYDDLKTKLIERGIPAEEIRQGEALHSTPLAPLEADSQHSSTIRSNK